MKNDLSSLLTVGRARYVQNLLEDGAYRNPDHFVQFFLDEDVKQSTRDLTAALGLAKLAENGFYNYLLLRTLYYDHLLTSSVHAGVRQLVIIGSGTDTRAYRFEDVLLARGVNVIECDQAEAISEKEHDARKLSRCSHVRFCPLDLESTSPEDWARVCSYDAKAPTLFLIEGVTPYITTTTCSRWLSWLAQHCGVGSRFGCDYKLQGAGEEVGGSDGALTRLSDDDKAIAAFHERCGLRLLTVSRSEDLRRRFQSGCSEERPLFSEDLIISAAPTTQA